MSKFYIDDVDKKEPITTIAWTNWLGDEEYIILEDDVIVFTDDPSNEKEIFAMNKEDIPKLEAALAKARELGWFE